MGGAFPGQFPPAMRIAAIVQAWLPCSVRLTGEACRFFKPFLWLEVCSTKKAFSPPAQPPVTLAVGLFLKYFIGKDDVGVVFIVVASWL